MADYPIIVVPQANNIAPILSRAPAAILIGSVTCGMLRRDQGACLYDGFSPPSVMAWMLPLIAARRSLG